MLIPLGMAAYVGLFARYLADDFCTLGSLRELGFFGSQVHWYMNWSGRYTFTFAVNLLEEVGAWVVPVLPLISLLALSVGLTLAFDRWLRSRLSPRARVAVAVIGLLVVFETVSGAPNLYQSLYWQTGSLTYIAPLVVVAFYGAWMLRKIDAREIGLGWSILSAAWVGIAVGFSETIGALIISAIIGSWALLEVFSEDRQVRRAGRRLLAAGLAGGVLGMLVMAAAPGNAVRQGLLTPSTSWTGLITESGRNAYIFSVKALKATPVRLLLTAVVPASMVVVGGRRRAGARDKAPRPLRQVVFLIALPFLGFALVMACMAPVQYAMSSYPDGRTLVGAQFTIATTMAVWGAVLGLTVLDLWPNAWSRWLLPASWSIWLVSVALLGLASVQAAGAIAGQLPDARDFARRWDERNSAVIHAQPAGDAPLAVASLTHMGGLDEISRDPNNWVNRCFAQAYGLRHVVAK